MWFSKNTDEELLKQLIQMMEETSKELTIHIKTLEKVGVVQESITKRLDHIESKVDQANNNKQISNGFNQSIHILKDTLYFLFD